MTANMEERHSVASRKVEFDSKVGMPAAVVEFRNRAERRLTTFLVSIPWGVNGHWHSMAWPVEAASRADLPELLKGLDVRAWMASIPGPDGKTFATSGEADVGEYLRKRGVDVGEISVWTMDGFQVGTLDPSTSGK